MKFGVEVMPLEATPNSCFSISTKGNTNVKNVQIHGVGG
jgi:hypothetical protein